MKENKGKRSLRQMVLAAMFLAIGIVLPIFTGQIPQIGRMLLPMHLPVLLCGLICGWRYGGAVGFVLPFLRYVMFGMPPMPNGIAMAFELASYGIIVGAMYGASRWQCVVALYRSLLTAMVGGRLVWAAVRVIITGAAGVPFTWEIFLAEGFLSAIPGIIFQLIFIPAVMVALDRTGFVRFRKSKEDISTAAV